MFSRLLMLGVTQRLFTLFLLTCITAIAALGIPHLHIDTGFSSLIPSDDPNKISYEQITAEFGTDNRTMVFVQDENLWSPEKLSQLDKLRHSLLQLDYVKDVDSIFNLRTIHGVDGKIESQYLLPQVPTTQAQADKVRAEALYNPLFIDHYVAKNGDATVLIVSLHQQNTNADSDLLIATGLDQAVAPFKADFQELFQLGQQRVNHELKSVLIKDLSKLGPLSILVLVITSIIFLRSGFAALSPLLTSVLSITWTLGFLGWMNIPLNILSAMLPSLIIAIGSTEDTHMISGYYAGLDKYKEGSKKQATHYMMRLLGVPLILTVATTAIGFASNMFSSIGLIRDFALAATFAMIANGIITLLLVPMLLSTFGPNHARQKQLNNRTIGVAKFFVWLFGVVYRNCSSMMLILTLIVCSLFLYQASKLTFTNDPMAFFKQDQPIIQDTNTLHKSLSGIKEFYITLKADKDKAFLEPKNLNKLVEIQGFLKQQGVFDSSLSLADHLSLINQEFHNGNSSYYSIPRKKELVAQYLLFFQRPEIQSFISHDLRRANIIVRHNISNSTILNKHIEELREVAAYVAGSEMDSFVVGENLMINAAAEELVVEQGKSLLLLLAVIFLIMSIMFTSIKGGILALIPNLIPIIAMLGVMGMLGIPMNPGTAMVAVIIIGISIDNTIHLFTHYNRLCRSTTDSEEALLATVREQATPMVATALSLALGFAVLLQSNIILVAQFGMLAATAMVFTLLANMIITPLIMTRVRLVGLYDILSVTLEKGVLKNSTLFQDMSNYEIRKAIVISELQKYRAGDRLIEQGAIGRSMYLILTGQAEVIKRRARGDLKLATLNAGQIFGEIGYIKQIQRTTDVIAITDVTVLAFDYERSLQDLKFFPRVISKLNLNISRVLGERLAEVVAELADRK